MFKIVCLATLVTFLNAQTIQSNPTNWDVKPDYQIDSLPVPDGEFELRGMATGQDEDHLYITVYADQNLMTGVRYKDVNVHIGDLLIRYQDGFTQAIRVTQFNRSELPIGKIVTNPELFSVSKQVHGQASLSEYRAKLNAIGIQPFNTYSKNSLLGDSTESLGKLTSLSTFSDVSFVDTDFEATGLGEKLFTVQIPKQALRTVGGTVSITLECGNDFIEIDIPDLNLVSVTPETSEIVTATEVTTTDIETVEEENSILEYSMGGIAIVVLIYLLMSGDGNTDGNFNNSIDPDQPPSITPIDYPTISKVSENRSVKNLLFVFLFLSLFSTWNKFKKR
jgi:hypothetical protein